MITKRHVKVWIPGGTGMLGRAVQDRLREDAVAHVATGSAVDVANRDAIRRFVDETTPSHIINCAAYTAVDDAENEREAAERVNTTGAGHLAALAAERGISLLHVSTDYVFDGRAAHPYPVDAACSPRSVYGKTKRRGEESVLATVEDGSERRVHVVRTSWLFGPGGRNFVTTMLRLMSERRTLQVVADQHGRPTYTRDLAGALTAIAIGGDAPSGIHHVCNAGRTTWHGFASAIWERARQRGWPTATEAIEAVDTRAFPRPASRPLRAILDTSGVQALGIAPRPWTEALDDYLNELRS